MKTIVRLIAMLLLFAIAQTDFSASGEMRKFTVTHFVDNRSSKQLPKPTSFPAKAMRVKPKSGNIFIVPKGNLSEECLFGAQLAADYWSAELMNREPIYIEVQMGVLSSDTAMKIDVVYFENEPYSIPSALVSQSFGRQESTNIDAVVTLNSIGWSLNTTPSVRFYGSNIYSHMLRAIGISLGFGSNLKQDDGNPNNGAFQNNIPSVFDAFIVSDNGEKLVNCDAKWKLMSFAQKSKVYFDQINEDYRLYSPNFYQPYKSLIYMNSQNSLMYYDFGVDDQIFHIDATTRKIMQKIGWGNEYFGEYDNTFRIVCDELDENNVGVANDPMTFYLVGQSALPLTDCEWRYILHEKTTGKADTVFSGSSNRVTIPALRNPAKYLRNSNGDIVGRMEWSYSLGGKYCKAEPLGFAVLAGPEILNVSSVKKIYSDDGENFQAEFKVTYRGTDYLKIEVEEEGDPGVRTSYTYEPLVATVRTGNICKYFTSWIDITAIQGDISVTHTVEVEAEPYIVNSTKIDDEDGIRVYSANNGGLVGKYRSMDELDLCDFKPGMYIIHTVKNDEVIKHEKIIVK